MVPGVPVAIQRRRWQGAVVLGNMPVRLPLAANSVTDSAIRSEYLTTCWSSLHSGDGAGYRAAFVRRRQARGQQDGRE